MIDALVRASCRAQAWLLRRPGFLSRAALTAFYDVELLLYAGDPHAFIARRRALMGPNFAALGRVVVGEHGQAAALIAGPQRRGAFIGVGRVRADRFPPQFPLFQDDGEVGADKRHDVLHAWLFKHWLEPAQDRLDDPKLGAIVEEAAAALAALPTPRTEAAVRPVSDRAVVRYMAWALLGLEPDEGQIAALIDLANGQARLDNYVASAAYPVPPPAFALRRLQERTRNLAAFFATSPLLADHVAGPDNNHLSREQLAEVLMSLVTIAAVGGTGNLIVSLFTHTPEVPVDPSDERAVFGAILEAARIRPPVNEVNTLLSAPRTFEIEGKQVEFPEGTVVAASLLGAAWDALVFPDPHRFDPARKNLESHVLSFNSVGFHRTEQPTGRRACPGRNVAVRFATRLYSAHARRAGAAADAPRPSGPSR